MKKKRLTECSFDLLREQFPVLSNEQQMSCIGGGYFDDNGIGYYDKNGNYHWTRTVESVGTNSSFEGDSWDSNNNSLSAGGLYNPYSSTKYGTEQTPLSIDDYNTLARGQRWYGGFVDSIGYIDTYATSVKYGNSIYLGGSFYDYGSSYCPLSVAEFYQLVGEGRWHGGYVQGWGQVSAETTILGNSGYYDEKFNINDAIRYLALNAEEKSIGKCATAVRKALEAGGLSTTNRPNYAGSYDSYLPQIGFTQVTTSNGYIPQAGDIIIHEATTGHSIGHIAMYDGSRWISDFVQRDMYGGSAYRAAKNYTIMRWNH